MDPKKSKDPYDYLSTWLERYCQASEVAPDVQRLHEIEQWKRQTLEQRPTEVYSLSVAKINESNELFYDRLEANLPMIPAIDRTLVTEVSSTAAFTASTVINYLEDVSQLQTPAVAEYVESAVDAYRVLRELHRQPEQIRALLKEKLPSLIARFDSALDSYRRWRSGQGTERGVAIDMRTFLEGLRGELWEKARHRSKENMTDECMVERLFSSVATRKEVQAQFDQRSDLIAALSDVGKGRDVLGKHRLDVLWSRVLNYAFVVLTALR